MIIHSYIISSGPLTSFTTFEWLFLVSTVTFDKPLLSIKNIKPKSASLVSFAL